MIKKNITQFLLQKLKENFLFCKLSNSTQPNKDPEFS